MMESRFTGLYGFKFLKKKKKEEKPKNEEKK